MLPDTTLDTSGSGPVTAAWSLRLLGTLEATDGTRRITRFPSRAAALLAARLALAPQRLHPREELVELLWPGTPLDVGRNRLRYTLSVLKTALEEGRGTPVIEADRLGLRVAAGSLDCDAVQFERHLRAGDWDRADALFSGELLPGFYDEWVLQERARLASLAERLQDRPRVPGSSSAPQPTEAPGGLPAYWTRLFGTEANVQRLSAQVREQRLVTVFGAGGSGKTRLAVEAARELAGHAFEVAVFVSLVDCSDAARAVDGIAAALRVQGRDPLKAVAAALAGRRVLLVLDNYEQLVGHADHVLRQLLTDTATLHLLVTSRQRLNVDGEHLFELAGLPLPAPDTDAPAGQAAAAALFVDRATAAAPGFQATLAEQPAIAELVRLLAGMPLAIELAASRMRGLTPRELLALLGQGRAPMLDLLAREGGSQSLAQRHASMRHVVAWSWRQLGPELVALMQALAAFAAPALTSTVAAVARLPLALAHERLAQLADHSLVVSSRDAAGTARHVLLQPVREFVLEATPPDVLPALRARLRAWLLEYAQQQATRGHASIANVQAELPQVYAAVLGAPADGPDATLQAVRLAVALRRHWEIDTRAGLPLAVMTTLQTALPAVQEVALRCELCVLLAFSNVLAGYTAEAMAHAREAVELAPDARRRAQALLRMGQVTMFSPVDQSGVDAPLAEAVDLAREAGDLEAEAMALRMQFLVAVNRDDDSQRAEALAQRAQLLWEQVGHRRNAYGGLMDRASCWVRAGRLDEAATALAACEHAALQEGYATGHIMSSWQLGRALLKLRHASAALAAFQRCLRESWRHQRLAYAADALVLVPGGLAFAGQPELAARLLGFAAAHWQRQFGTFYRDLDRDVCVTRRWLRHHLGPLRLEALRLEGLGLGLPEAVALALGEARTAA